MARDGAGDTREEALAYLEATVGDEGPATSRARTEAFVDTVDEWVTLAERLGVRFARAADYPDYYPELPGGKIGRALEVEPFDAKRLGPWWDTARAKEDGVPLPAKTDDFWLLSRAWSTPGGMVRGAQVVARVLGGLVRGKQLIGMGGALTAALLDVVLNLGGQLWLSAPIEELVVEGGRVVGAVVRRDGEAVRVRASRGVVLAGGGFAHRTEWREKYHGIPGFSSANRGNLGTAIELGQEAGAAVALMDDAWWGASIPAPNEEVGASFIVGERSFPHSIIVDARGDRFANESESYVDLGHAMLEHSQHVDGPSWMISDARHTRRYLRSFAIMPGVLPALREAGLLHTAPKVAELAAAIGVDADRLIATIRRFNGFALTGIDQDFGRGNSAYDRYYADPLVRPNPNLGPLLYGPFTAVQLVPGDLGTKGGAAHRRRRPRAARGRLPHRRAVRRGQHHGQRHGAHLPRPRRHPRPGGGVRAPGRAAPGARTCLGKSREGARRQDRSTVPGRWCGSRSRRRRRVAGCRRRRARRSGRRAGPAPCAAPEDGSGARVPNVSTRLPSRANRADGSGSPVPEVSPRAW